MAETAGAVQEDGVARSTFRKWREAASRLALPILTTVVSAVLIANFVTSRQDAQHLQRQRDLETKAGIANEMSNSAVRLIVASEYRARATLRGGDKPLATATAPQAVAEFLAASTVIRAKLQAYYSDASLALAWKRYTNAVVAFVDLSSLPDRLRTKLAPKLLVEIQRAFVGAQAVDRALEERVPEERDWTSRQVREKWLERSDRIGELLVARGAVLTRQALE